MRRALALAAALLAAAPLAAQGGAPEQDKDARWIDSMFTAPRPMLRTPGDDKDYVAYVESGRVSMRLRNPREAAVAFLWASRLSPAQAEPLVLAWQAIWSASPTALRRWAKRDRKFVATGAGERVDSLLLRALARDPFSIAVLEDRSDWMRNAMVRGAYDVIAKDSNAVDPRLWLASLYYREAKYDSSVAHVRGAMRALDRVQGDGLRAVYQSRELFHYAIGNALLAKGDREGARGAFQRALEENAGFPHAHARLGWVAWDNWADTSVALIEYRSAVASAPHDAALRNDFGGTLLLMGRHDEALAEFEAAISAAPDYALPYYNAAMAAERLARPADAARWYRAFLERAPQRMADAISRAQARLAVLASG